MKITTTEELTKAYKPKYIDTYAYLSQLRGVWLDLVKKYSDVYDITDYVEACNKKNILV